MKYSSPTIELEHLATEKVMNEDILTVSGNDGWIPYGDKTSFWEGQVE